MTRTERFENSRKNTDKVTLSIVLFLVAIVGFCVTTTIMVNKENDRLKNFIRNYDKHKEVYNLQYDFEGGNY